MGEFSNIIVNNLHYIGKHFCSTLFYRRYSIFSDTENSFLEFRGRISKTNIYPVIAIRITDNACRFSVDYINDSYDEFIMYQLYKSISDTSKESLETMFVEIGISLAKAKAAAGISFG